MTVLPVKLLTDTAKMPERAHEGDAGLDLFLDEDGPIDILPGCHRLCKTGVSVALPPATVGFVCSRSGMALKQGLFVLNAPGVIDVPYRGECGVILANFSATVRTLNRGDKIAQLVIVPALVHLQPARVNDLGSTDRGDSGFGSTGGMPS